MKLNVFITLFLFMTSPVFAADLHIAASATGDESGSDTSNFCTLAYANSNLSAGETGYLYDDQGDFSAQSISPTNSGTSENRITYVEYAGETPTFTGQSTITIFLYGDDYITVDGITASDVARFFVMFSDSDYNEIKNSTFNLAFQIAPTTYRAGVITSRLSNWDYTDPWVGSTHNWIHDNTFSRHGALSSCEDFGTISIGSATSPGLDEGSYYNTIENNTFFYGGHDNFEIADSYNTFRNNVLYNPEEFLVDPGGCTNSPTSGYFGNRNFLTQSWSSFNLIEGNRVGHAGLPPDDDGSHGIVLGGFDMIVRYNASFNNGGSGIYFKLSASDNNKVYNNTVFYNGYGDEDLPDYRRGGMAFGNNGAAGNIIINNLLYGSNLTDGEDWQDAGVPARLTAQTITNNYLSTDADPSFVNTTIDTPANTATEPNFSLQNGSGAIDAGIKLTDVAVADSGSGTTLYVDEAGFFQDGSWGSSLSSMSADFICVGTVSNCVQISSINYSTDVITLVSSISRNDADDVWLYKDSDGDIVLLGSAPDQGAYEFDPGVTTVSPAIGGYKFSVGGYLFNVQ